MTQGAAIKPTALVVDDELQIRRLLRACLESNGYRVLEAATGAEAIAQAAQHPLEVVLLDLGLPDLDGVSVLKRLREWSRVPVVVLSVRDREEDKIAALDNGADDYVTKPFSTGELLARLRVAQPRRHRAGPGDRGAHHDRARRLGGADRAPAVAHLLHPLVPDHAMSDARPPEGARTAARRAEVAR